MIKLNLMFFLSVLFLLIPECKAEDWMAQVEVNRKRAGELLQLIEKNYQNSEFISQRCIGALLSLQDKWNGKQGDEEARIIYKKLYSEGKVDLAFFVNGWRLGQISSYEKNTTDLSLFPKSAYLQYELAGTGDEGSRMLDLSEAVPIHPELSLLFCHPQSTWMLKLYGENAAIFASAIFLSLAPEGSITNEEMIYYYSIPSWDFNKHSMKENLKKLYSICIPEKYTGLVYDAFRAGLLYHMEEKEKALELYSQLVKSEIARLKDFMKEMYLKKKYERIWTSIRRNKNYAEFVLLQGMYGRMTELLVEQGRIAEAYEAIKQGHQLFPESARLYCIEADIAIRQTNLDYARTLYEKALTVNPEYVPAYLGLSRLDLAEKRDPYELLEKCTRVIEFEGIDSKQTTQALGLMLQRLKE